MPAIGRRIEIEGKKDHAIEAYQKSVEFGALPSAHHTRFWSAYRLGVLAGTSTASAPVPP